ncbi:MAG: M13 family metallopeptidase [Chloroflexia bacterium]|nr:M13 family metallopeptidase [Chloroflexia bacterium]
MPRLPQPLRAALLALALLLAGLPLAAISALAQATPIAAAGQGQGQGIDVANMDLAVDPRDDFYDFANGGWLARTEIPADRPAIGVFVELRDEATRRQITLLDGAVDAAAGTDEAKAVALFAQGLDLDQRNRQGVAPIRDALDRIAAVDSAAAFDAYQRRSPFDGVAATLPLSVLPDANDSAVNTLYLGGPTLGLPNRDYYLDDDPSNLAVREAYVENTTAMLGFAGYEEEEAATAAQAIYDFEAKLAAPTLTREQEQDFSLQNNPLGLAELAARYPAMDWPAYLADLGVSGVETVIVTQEGYLEALPGIVAETPPAALRAYLTLRLLRAWDEALSEEIEAVSFAFSQVLSGVEEQPALEERVLNQVNAALPDAVGQLYVAEYFPPAAKAEIEALTGDVLAAFRVRLEANPWMTPETRARAVEKLDAVSVKVGYPDRWRGYADVALGDSFAATLDSAAEVEIRRQYAKAGQPVDRTEWDAPAQLVNAFYNPLANEIVFPAGILQPPFFDAAADPAPNYGAIGFVIGHEITHGFDLSGSQFGPTGNFEDWWTPEDRERFLALNEELAAQYDAIEVAPGLFVNGQITVGENAADLGGIQVAADALQRRLAEETGATPAADPVLDPEAEAAATPTADSVVIEPPFTPEQRFFVAAATVWRTKARPAYVELLVRSDSHSPGEVRAVQPLRNAAAFFAAFGIGPADAEWLAPAARVVIW